MKQPQATRPRKKISRACLQNLVALECERAIASHCMNASGREASAGTVVATAKKISRARRKIRRGPRRCGPPKDDRLMLSAILYVLRTGVAWRDLPQGFGPWSSVYSRWRRWTASGLWDRMLSAVALRARGTTRFVDSTHIKLHQDGANPAGGPDAQAIGRTKGGLNSKVTAMVDSYGRAVALSLHPGPRNDVRPMDEHVCCPSCARSRARTRRHFVSSLAIRLTCPISRPQEHHVTHGQLPSRSVPSAASNQATDRLVSHQTNAV